MDGSAFFPTDDLHQDETGSDIIGRPWIMPNHLSHKQNLLSGRVENGTSAGFWMVFGDIPLESG